MTEDLARKIREKYGPASIITAFNVFAHADDLNGMAESIRQMLATDGVFLFEAQYLVDIVEKMLLGTIFHEHMSHHSLKPMKKFLARHGMELIDVQRVTIQKGSIIAAVQHQGGPHAVQPAVGELLALEEDRVWTSPKRSSNSANACNEPRKRSAVDRPWKRRGATMAAYGAARSGPTFIVQFGLGDAISCIFDDHPQKVHRSSPGDTASGGADRRTVQADARLRFHSGLDPRQENRSQQSEVPGARRALRGPLPRCPGDRCRQHGTHSLRAD